MFISRVIFESRNRARQLAMAFGHYRQWLQMQAFVRQRDPFFPDPPVTI